MKKLDYLIVGSGLYGAVFAYEIKKAGYSCLVIDKKPHLAGNVFTESIEGIQVHKYGAHIFHTDNMAVWDYVNRFTTFNRYTNSPIANFKGKLYNLPFNMNTFYQIWGVTTPKEAHEKIEQQKLKLEREPQNLEEQALSLVGRDIYEILIKGYTQKQWGNKATELPTEIIRRLPVRFIFDNNYFNDRYQGIPLGGYTQIIEKLLDGIEVRLSTDFNSDRDYFTNMAQKIVYTGMIDEFFGYELGELGYRSLRFENKLLDVDNFQGNAVVNYTEYEIPFTRIIEHKHFEFGAQPKTIVTYEYPASWTREKEAYYPINDEKNNILYAQYVEKAKVCPNILFGGRLGKYRYFDMDDVIESALQDVMVELKRRKIND